MIMSWGSVNKDLPVPLYHQLKDVLLKGIETGQWKSDEQLPNETRLAEHYGVSKITVRQALQELATMGYIRREQGRGTFVSQPKFYEGPRELMSFTEEMQSHKLAPASRVLERGVLPADPEVAGALGIAEGESVFVLKRLRLAEGEPMGIQTASIPLAIAPGLPNDSFENVSLYGLLQSRYHVHPANARETYRSTLVDESDAVLLQIPAGAPVLAAERVTFSRAGAPFEFVRSVMRGDRYRIVLNLVK
jgi:GntR family transcriptional regulator